jgi:hypothetical protein
MWAGSGVTTVPMSTAGIAVIARVSEPRDAWVSKERSARTTGSSGSVWRQAALWPPQISGMISGNLEMV